MWDGYGSGAWWPPTLSRLLAASVSSPGTISGSFQVLAEVEKISVIHKPTTLGALFTIYEKLVHHLEHSITF
jgi:hypothetical protein